jgi:hypothetical protein
MGEAFSWYANGINFAWIREPFARRRFYPMMTSVIRRAALFATLIGVVGCTAQHAPLPITAPADVKSAAVARRPLDVPLPALTVPSEPQPKIVVPPGTLYVCVADRQGTQTQTAIEFSPKVGALCTRHPEMGPCQYERDLCRNSGGRVFAASGQEITRQIEDEYDRKVMRVRFRAN